MLIISEKNLNLPEDLLSHTIGYMVIFSAESGESFVNLSPNRNGKQ